MDVVEKIGPCTHSGLFSTKLMIFIYLENVPKGGNDRPTVDVVIADSGEVRSLYIYSLNITYLLILQLPVENEGDGNGKEVPAHAEL